MPTNSSRRNSILIAAAIAIGLAIWLASGLGGISPNGDSEAQVPERSRTEVRFREFHASPQPRRIGVSARTEPDRAVELKGETEGRVVSIGAERGTFVAAGSLIVELDMRDRRARLAEAEALIRQRELEFEAAERLRADGFMSEAELAAAESLLVGAHAARERVALDIERTRITAPFDAIIYDRVVEVGDYISVGDPIAQLVDSDPLIVAGDVNQRDVVGLEVGGKGAARLIGSTEVQGTIRYLAPAADESTRSFRIELAIPNPDRKHRVGTSAELILGGEEIIAHTISSGLLQLDNAERIGVMTVDANERARFMPVELAGSSGNSVLVTGLPANVRIITVGQGFVTDGQAVTAVDEATIPATNPR